MSNALKVGDRVRYKFEMVEQGFLHPRKLELTGKILRLPQGQGKCYLVKWNDVADSETTVHGSWLESAPPSGRTFEEICNELKETMEERSWTVELSSCGAAHVVKNREVHCIIGCDGTLEIITEEGSSFFDASDLAAISAACTEIADNYQAEHRKENQQ